MCAEKRVEEKGTGLPMEWHLPSRPRGLGELQGFVRRVMGIKVPRTRVCPGHDAPMDYLYHAFRRRAGNAVVWACRGGSKTMLAAAATVAESLYTPGLDTRILGGSLAQSSYMYEYIRAFMRRPQFDNEVKHSTQERLEFKNGAVVEILPQSERTVRGIHVPRVKLDEVEEFREDVFNAALFLPQSRGDVKGRIDMLSTLHRPYGLMSELVDRREQRGVTLFKWCLWEIIERCRDRECGRCALQADCGGKAKLSTGYYSVEDAISRKKLVSDEAWESEMLCKRPSREGLVYKAWDESLHVAPAALGYDARCPLYRAFDWGMNSPTVCLWVQVDGDERVRVIDEMRQQGIAVSDMARAVKRYEETKGYPPAQRSYCDPSGACFMEEFRKEGIDVQGRGEDGGTVNSRWRGMEAVRRSLKCDDLNRPRLCVSPTCVDLIREFRTYRYPANRPGSNPSEEPIKADDHGLDALRYFFTSLFPPQTWQVV